MHIYHRFILLVHGMMGAAVCYRCSCQCLSWLVSCCSSSCPNTFVAFTSVARHCRRNRYWFVRCWFSVANYAASHCSSYIHACRLACYDCLYVYLWITRITWSLISPKSVTPPSMHAYTAVTLLLTRVCWRVIHWPVIIGGIVMPSVVWLPWHYTLLVYHVCSSIYYIGMSSQYTPYHGSIACACLRVRACVCCMW